MPVEVFFKMPCRVKKTVTKIELFQWNVKCLNAVFFLFSAFFLEPPGDFNSSYDNYPCPQEIKSEYDDLEAASKYLKS